MLHLSAENGILSKINMFRLTTHAFLGDACILKLISLFHLCTPTLEGCKWEKAMGHVCLRLKSVRKWGVPHLKKIKELWKMVRCLPFYGKRVTWISDDYIESFLIPQLLRELKSLNLICHFYMHCQPSLCRLHTRLKRPLLPKHFFISQFEGSFHLKTKDREFRMKVRFAYNSWAKNILKMLRRFL